MRAWLKEPYIQFLLGGALIYLFYTLSGSSSDVRPAQKTITINMAKQQEMDAYFAKLWHRRPSEAERQLLLRRVYEEEMLIDESLALHLERSDPVIRKRLLEKMHHILTASALSSEPDEEVLYRYYREHIIRYSRIKKIAFSHIFAKPEHRRSLEKLFPYLNRYEVSPKEASRFGDPFEEGNRIDARNPEEIEEKFGRYFLQKLQLVPEGEWSGPIRGKEGLHAVYVTGREVTTPLPFDEVEMRVYQDWLHEKREKGVKAALEKMHRSYRMRVE